MATILITHGVPLAGFEALTDAGHTLIVPQPLAAYTEQELLQLIPQCDAVVAGGRLSADVIRAGAKLKIIANYGAGYDRVDLPASVERGIPVTNIPETVTDSTAELAMGLMLSVSRRIGEMTLRLRREKSETLFGMGRFMGHNLHGKTLGIIGCGRIGTRVAQMASAFGMRCISYSHLSALPREVEAVSGLDELLRQSDIITLHCPLNEHTRSLLDERAFSLMRDGAMLINTSRGAVIDTQAMVESLRSGRLIGAGLDVYPDEPHIPAELLAMDNVVCTPHVGTNTAETRQGMAKAICAQIFDALDGKRPVNIVNGL